MIRPLLAAFAVAGLSLPSWAVDRVAHKEWSSGGDGSTYLQIIIKACPQAEVPLEPTNQGKIYNDEAPKTLEERKAALTEMGCIDVPIPMEHVADMSETACRGHAGYVAAMRFLQGRQDLADFPAVGAWQCMVTDYEVVGAATM
ncbi:MAG: hypothetical protein ACRECX_12650 [Methyloceanibacter sp.]|uniref:hypothetical protein n=1 Tax=Methyloceanibacter sp. TaxID=1965321 RepID=UPI003D6CD6B8